MDERMSIYEDSHQWMLNNDSDEIETFWEDTQWYMQRRGSFGSDSEQENQGRDMKKLKLAVNKSRSFGDLFDVALMEEAKLLFCWHHGCPQGSRIFPSKEALAQHQAQHDVKIRCIWLPQGCEWVFSSELEMDDHVKRVHLKSAISHVENEGIAAQTLMSRIGRQEFEELMRAARFTQDLRDEDWFSTHNLDRESMENDMKAKSNPLLTRTSSSNGTQSRIGIRRDSSAGPPSPKTRSSFSWWPKTLIPEATAPSLFPLAINSVRPVLLGDMTISRDETPSEEMKTARNLRNALPCDTKGRQARFSNEPPTTAVHSLGTQFEQKVHAYPIGSIMKTNTSSLEAARFALSSVPT